jgi:hypothetical protein
MRLFNKLPNYVRYSTHTEWALLKKLPWVWLGGTFLLAIPLIRMWLQAEALLPEQSRALYVDLGLLFTFWFFVGAAAIGLVVVIIMKGPGYVADPYELPKEDKRLENSEIN